MLANSQISNANIDKSDLSTYLAIPIDSIKNTEDHSNLKVVQNIIIKQLEDGSICLVEAEEENNQNGFFGVNGEYSIPVASRLSNDVLPRVPVRNRTIFLQPPKRKAKCVNENTFPNKKLLAKPCTERYNCMKCDNLFTSLEAFRSHMKWHKCRKRFKCSKCRSGYNIENNLKIHMVLMHSEEHTTQCPICHVTLTFKRNASLRSHLMLHQVEEFYTCEACESEFEKEDDLIKHMETHATEKKKDGKPLTCSYCKVEFQDSKEYRLHISDHMKLKKTIMRNRRPRKPGSKKHRKHVCGICQKVFIKQSLLERHERIHSGERPFKCKFCDRGFTQKGTLQIHLSRHTGIKPFSCTLCPARFNQKGNLRVHIEKTHTFPNEGQKMFKCSQCTCIFKKIATLNGHVTKAHLNSRLPDKKIIDDVMLNLKELVSGEPEKSKDLAKEPSYPNHPVDTDNMETDKENSSVVNESDVELTHPAYVNLSESTHDGAIRKYIVRQTKIGDVRWYFCSYCSKQFKKPSDLIRHIRVHTKEKPFKCNDCTAAFSLKSTLMSHMNTHKKKPEYRCKTCNATFTSLRVLNAHIGKHDFEALPKWQCITCGYLFDELEMGIKHREEDGTDRIHVIQPFIQNIMKQPLYQTPYGSLSCKPPKPRIPNTGTESPTTRPFQCTLCDARFTRKLNLKRHIQYHAGERKFKCTICPKAFITSYRLTEHLNFHNNIKNHGCKTCGKRFVTASLLKRHVLTHNTVKPYECPYCAKTFKTLLLCTTHIKQVHRKDVIPKVIRIPNESEPEQFLENNLLEAGSESLLNKNSSILVNSDQNASQVAVEEPKNSEIQQFEPTSNSVHILNINNGESEDGTNFQTIYVNIDDLQFLENSNLNLSSTTLQSQLKLQSRDSLLINPMNGLQESNVIFNIETLKSSLGLPAGNQVFTTSKAQSEDITTTTLPSIAEISTKNIKFNSFSEKTFGKDKLYGENLDDLLGNGGNLYQNVTFTEELTLPINVVEGNEFTGSTAATILNNTEDYFEESNIVCMNCKKLFTNVDYFQSHSCEEQLQDKNKSVLMKSKNGEIDEEVEDAEGGVQCLLECHICKKVLPDKINLENHLNGHSVKSKFECTICRKVIMGRNPYVRHLTTHTASTGALLRTCKFCFKDFKKPSDLKRHLRTHTGEKPFDCPRCDKKFSLKSTLESHAKTHDPAPKEFNCNICNSLFSSKSSLKVHMTLHTGQKPYTCSFCDQKFRTAGNRKSHQLLMHLTKSNKPGESKKPQKITNLLESMASEIVSNADGEKEMKTGNAEKLDVAEHTKMNELSSQIVNLIADSQPLLPALSDDQVSVDPVILLQQLHMSSGMILTGENEVSSLILDELALLNMEAKDEIQIISLPTVQSQSDTNGVESRKAEKVRNLECSVCHKMYASKDVLRKHLKKVHGRNKKFPCIKCDKNFGTQDELNKHVKLHSGYRPFSCMHCANSFTEEQSLKTHMKRIHQHSNASKETTNALLNIKFDLPSSNIEDPIFNNLFTLKKID